MVGEGTTKCAEMALLLHTVHRWCVTGTPIPRSLEDLFGLLLFLGIPPYTNKRSAFDPDQCLQFSCVLAQMVEALHQCAV